MNKRESNKELEVDFIGGEELTKEEESELSNFFKEERTGQKTPVRNKAKMEGSL